MKLPIDTAGLTFIVLGPPVPVRDFETKQAKGDADGVPLYSVKLAAVNPAAGDSDLISVKVAGEPSGLVLGMPARVSDLTAQPWSIGDKSGVAFRASAIESAVPARNGSGSGS